MMLLSPRRLPVLLLLIAVTAPTTVPFALPQLHDDKPRDYPGLHNVVAFAPDLYSGAVPEGDEGFASLKALGIKTILTVDGGAPELDRAKKFGLRYVHLPIAYSGMESTRTLEIARAVKDLPKPLYLHCHHGKHRSAAALGAAAVTLGLLTPEEAVARMKVSGTSPSYPGLYACVNAATVADALKLASADASFPETSKVPDFIEAMVEIDEVFDRLKLIEKAGWKAPANHPDLVPAAEAGKLADLYRQSVALPLNYTFKDDKHSLAELKAWLAQEQKNASALEEGLVKGDTAADHSKRFKAVAQSCTDCHAKYRNEAR